MRSEEYTAQNICVSLGLPGFATDPVLLGASEALRLLLKPSFHPEVCVTFYQATDAARISIIAAREMIWRKFEPVPSLTFRDQGKISPVELSALTAAFTTAAEITTWGGVRGIAIDGMPTNILLARNGNVLHFSEGNAGKLDPMSEFISNDITIAWNSTENAPCKNALAHAARYVGLDLPQVSEPPRKPTIETMVLGSEEDRRQLLDALRKHHGEI